ncbi:MAG: DAK2 domain-containing protein [Oscillospiraceae bacterium]
MREIIDAAALREMLLCANAALEENKQRINELNVFPVPDGDTGTNMSLTMNSAAIELGRKQTDTVGAVADCAASALLRGARGNSGVILSLLFRGIAKSLKGRENANAAEFAAAVSAGVDAAYKAVMKPAEGTILTVSRLGAQAAVEFAKESTDFEAMLEALLAAAREALADTQNINPVLRRAGVVDAGGEGFVLVMDAMLGYLQGRTAAPVTAAAPAAAAAPKEGADFSEFDTGEITFGYCTEFIVARENNKSPELLRSFLNNLGDCVVVVDDDEIIKVHVHTNVPGEVLTEALTYGPLQTVKIENMRNQHTALSGSDAPAAPEAEPAVAAPEKQFGVVAVSAGEGMADLFRELGVDRVVTGGQTMNPSTEDILTEVNKTPAEVVFVLPNNKNIIMAAQQCIPLSDKKVIVIPTKTVPQGITAMLSFDPASAEDVIEAEMSAAIESVHTAQVTYAARDSDFDGHDIHKGEYLALMDGALLGSNADLDKVLLTIADAATDLDPEIVSIYYGEDVKTDAAQHAAELIGGRLPMSDVNVVDGGQPVYYYMISFE